MDAVRTPNDRFNGIPDWPYEARYVNIGDDLRVHYVDEGTGPVVLLLHGEPTWGYLYRKMIPGLVEAGCRVVVPDLVGFGKSDKPTSRDDYTYGRHLRWLSQTIEEIDVISAAAANHHVLSRLGRVIRSVSRCPTPGNV